VQLWAGHNRNKFSNFNTVLLRPEFCGSNSTTFPPTPSPQTSKPQNRDPNCGFGSCYFVIITVTSADEQVTIIQCSVSIYFCKCMTFDQISYKEIRLTYCGKELLHVYKGLYSFERIFISITPFYTIIYYTKIFR
jgi:hypothetical protein